ncbi:MAG: dipeptidase [Candidatus Binatia bacterium]
MTAERELASRLRCSVEAVELTRATDVIDLHLDTFIWMRAVGYDVLARHTGGPLGRYFFGHVDVPRLGDGGVTGAMWSITTNPFRSARRRWDVFLENLATLRRLIAGSDGVLAEVRSLSDYRAARARGAHACMPAIQGLHAIEGAPDGVASIPDDAVLRATLVHLVNATYGATSAPLGFGRTDKGLTNVGREVVAQMNARRVFVDLAHIHERAFWDAVAVHDRTQPLIATHTGVAGVRPHWRNLTDAQVKAIADTGGVVGIIFSQEFLPRPGGPRDGAMIVEHVEHVIRVAGEDAVALGSDFDGMITPPPDVASADAYPKIVQHMLDRGFSEDRIRKVLGGNFLRALGMLRP